MAVSCSEVGVMRLRFMPSNYTAQKVSSEWARRERRDAQRGRAAPRLLVAATADEKRGDLTPGRRPGAS